MSELLKTSTTRSKLQERGALSFLYDIISTTCVIESCALLFVYEFVFIISSSFTHKATFTSNRLRERTN